VPRAAIFGCRIRPELGAALAGISTQRLNLVEPGYSGTFTSVSSNTGVASVNLVGNVLTVTPGSTAGISTITVTDANGQRFSFDVSVTVVSLIID